MIISYRFLYKKFLVNALHIINAGITVIA